MPIRKTVAVFVDRRVVVGAVFLAALPSIFFSVFSEESGKEIVLIGWLYLVAASLPLLAAKKFFLFSPPVFVLFTVALGSYGRSFFLLYGDPQVVSFLTGGAAIHELVPYTTVGLIGLIFLSLGYISVRSRFPIERAKLFWNDHWCSMRVSMLAGVGLLFSAVAIWQVATLTGLSLDDTATLSKKRFVSLEVAGDSQSLAALGPLRMLAFTAAVAFVVTFSLAATHKKASPTRKVLLWFLAATLFAMAISFPIISSSRTSVFVIVVATIVAGASFRHRVPYLKVLAASVLLVVLALGMAQLRQMDSSATSSDDGSGYVDVASATGTAWEKIVGSGNFFPIARTAVIAAWGAESVPSFDGSTYAAFLVGWIPRTLWPEKPPVSLGGIVKSDIYGDRLGIGGYPPGFVGEAIMNFGVVGVPVVSWLLGSALRLWYNTFSPLIGTNRNATVVYALTVWSVGTQFVDLNFSLALNQIVLALAPTLVALWFIAKRQRGRLPP